MMKNILKTVAVLIAVFALFLSANAAFAANQFGTNQPVLKSKLNSGSCYNNNLCWGVTTSNVNPGDTIGLQVWFYNPTNVTANNVKIRVTPMTTGNGTTHTFTAYLSASNFDTLTGSTTVYTTAATSFSLSSVTSGTTNQVYVYNDLGGANGSSDATTQIIDGSSLETGIVIGDLAPDCAGDGGCHQGALVLQMKAAGAQTQNTCSVSNFTSSPSSVSSGSPVTLSWSGTNLSGGYISGPNLNSTYTTGSSGSYVVYPTVSGSYVFTPTCSNGGSASSSNTYVSVNTVQQNYCSISYFNTTPTSVSYGSSSNVQWATTGCTSVYVSGPGVTSSNMSGSISTGALYNYSTYTITAYGGIGGTQTQSAYVTVNNNNQNSCYISSITATPTYVTTGSPVVISWTAPGASYGYLSGPGLSSTYVSGAYGSYTVYPTVSSSYTLSLNCSGGYSNNLYQSVYVTVNGNGQYQCNDGIDNDGDGRIDLNDPGCSNMYDTDEYNYATTSVTTMSATGVFSTSAKLNAVFSNSGGYSSTGYFEWGTTSSLGNTTENIVLGTATSNNFWTTLVGLQGSRTYYYRAVATNSQGTFRGDILNFTTSTTPTTPVTPTVVTVVSGTGSGSNLVQLSSTPRFANVCVGDIVDYTIKYKNISGKSLDNMVIQVLLSQDVEYRNSSAGIYNSADNTITLPLGTLVKNQEGEFYVTGVVLKSAADRDLVVATATAAFTNPSNKAQETATAYGLVNTSSCPNNSNLAGLALFSGDFWPTTLVGWLLLLLLILVLIYLASRIYRERVYRKRAVGAPHYEDMDVPTYNGGH